MNIYKKLMNIQRDLRVNKSNNNSFGGYKYRKAEDILQAVKPFLVENNCVILLNNDITFVEGRHYAKSTAILVDCESGDKVEAVAFAREEETKAKMDGSQATGSSESYANKFSLGNLFGICEVDDSDTTCTHGKEESPKTQPKQNTQNTYNKKGISEAQKKRLLAIGGKAGVNEASIKKVIKAEYNLDDIMTLDKNQYEAICARLEAKSK